MKCPNLINKIINNIEQFVADYIDVDAFRLKIIDCNRDEADDICYYVADIKASWGTPRNVADMQIILEVSSDGEIDNMNISIGDIDRTLPKEEIMNGWYIADFVDYLKNETELGDEIDLKEIYPLVDVYTRSTDYSITYKDFYI